MAGTPESFIHASMAFLRVMSPSHDAMLALLSSFVSCNSGKRLLIRADQITHVSNLAAPCFQLPCQALHLLLIKDTRLNPVNRGDRIDLIETSLDEIQAAKGEYQQALTSSLL